MSTGRQPPRRRRTAGSVPGRRQLTEPSGCGTSRSTGPSRTRLLGPAASCRITAVRSWSGLMKPARFSQTPTVPSGSPCQPRRRSSSRSRISVEPGCACSTSATALSSPAYDGKQVGAAGFGVTGLFLEAFGTARSGSRSPAGAGPGGSRTLVRRRQMPRSRPCREGRSPGRPRRSRSGARQAACRRYRPRSRRLAWSTRSRSGRPGAIRCPGRRRPAG